MAKQEVEEVTEKTLKEGGILAKLYFDMQSEDKDQLQPLMTEFVNNNVLKTPGVVYCFGSIAEPMKVEEVFSTTATLTVLFRNLAALVSLSFQYTPAGVEVLRPDRTYVIKVSDLQSMLLDVANVSLDYSKFILSRVMKEEDYKKVTEQLKRREELGRKLIGKKESGSPAN